MNKWDDVLINILCYLAEKVHFIVFIGIGIIVAFFTRYWYVPLGIGFTVACIIELVNRIDDNSTGKFV